MTDKEAAMQRLADLGQEADRADQIKAPERIWIEDEFGDSHDDQWAYGSWDSRMIYGYVNEYIRADIAAKRIAELEAAVEAADKLAEYLADQIEDGCPLCGGDCSSANPPVSYCAIREMTKDLTAYRKTRKETE